MVSGGLPRGHALAPVVPAAAVLAAAVLAGAAACSSTGSAGQAGRGDASQTDYERVIKQVLPSVVQVDAGQSTGSGVVFNNKDDIVTNAHVVGAVRNVKVIASATARPLAARVIGIFTPDDLAVIKVSHPSHLLKPVRWANSAQVQAGQVVLAMGSPYGLTDSVTEGIISATGRMVSGPSVPGQPPTVITNALQTSAAINPGNSGGALVALSGDVVGIPALTARDPELGDQASGIGFAIPSNTVYEIATQLIMTGHVTTSDRASLEIIGRTDANAAGNDTGVSVDNVQPGGAAAAAGMQVGDVIVSVGGQRTPTLAGLENLLVSFQPGEKVTVVVRNDGRQQKLSVTLGSLSSRRLPEISTPSPGS
jgi:putative serine protease PepD